MFVFAIEDQLIGIVARIIRFVRYVSTTFFFVIVWLFNASGIRIRLYRVSETRAENKARQDKEGQVKLCSAEVLQSQKKPPFSGHKIEIR